MLDQLLVVVVHILATPCFIVLVKFWDRPRALRVHICCFPTVLSARLCRVAQVLLWFLSLPSSTGRFSAYSVLELLRKLSLAVLHKFCSRFVMVSTAKSRSGPPAATTRNLDLEEHVAQVSVSCSCQKWSATLWWARHLRIWANMSGEKRCPKKKARVNVTSVSALLPRW